MHRRNNFVLAGLALLLVGCAGMRHAPDYTLAVCSEGAGCRDLGVLPAPQGDEALLPMAFLMVAPHLAHETGADACDFMASKISGAAPEQIEVKATAACMLPTARTPREQTIRLILTPVVP